MLWEASWVCGLSSDAPVCPQGLCFCLASCDASTLSLSRSPSLFPSLTLSLIPHPSLSPRLFFCLFSSVHLSHCFCLSPHIHLQPLFLCVSPPLSLSLWMCPCLPGVLSALASQPLIQPAMGQAPMGSLGLGHLVFPVLCPHWR